MPDRRWIREQLVSANARWIKPKRPSARNKPARKYALRIWSSIKGTYGTIRGYRESIEECDFDEANIVLSHTKKGFHAPIFDLDFPCVLVESSTKNHYHLYMEREITWEAYKEIMKAMANAGLLDRGWVDCAVDRGHATLRKPELEIKKAFDVLDDRESSLYDAAEDLDVREKNR